MRAGEVVRVGFGVPIGSEPGFVRWAVVMTAGAVLEADPRTLHMVPLTTNLGRSLPTEVRVSSRALDRPSAAQVHLCTVISRERIVEATGEGIGPEGLAQLRSVLADLLDLP